LEDLFADRTASPEASPLHVLPTLTGDARAVARAMALLWTWRPRTATYELLRHLGAKTESA